MYLETKVNHVRLRVRSSRDDSRVEDLFLSFERRNSSEAAAEPTSELQFLSSSSKTKGWRSVRVQRWGRRQ